MHRRRGISHARKAFREIWPPYQVITEMAKMFELDNEFIKNASNAYNSNEISDIKLFPDVIPTLKELARENYMLFLLSTGIHERQQKRWKY